MRHRPSIYLETPPPIAVSSSQWLALCHEDLVEGVVVVVTGGDGHLGSDTLVSDHITSRLAAVQLGIAEIGGSEELKPRGRRSSYSTSKQMRGLPSSEGLEELYLVQLVTQSKTIPSIV